MSYHVLPDAGCVEGHWVSREKGMEEVLGSSKEEEEEEEEDSSCVDADDSSS